MDQPFDGVIEVVDAVEVVLGASCKEEPVLSRGIARGRHSLGGDIDRIDRIRGRVEVLDRTAGRAGGSDEVDGLGDTIRIIRETPLGIDTQGIETEAASASTWLSSSSLVTCMSPFPSDAACPGLVVAIAWYFVDASSRAEPTPMRSASRTIRRVERSEAFRSIHGHMLSCSESPGRDDAPWLRPWLGDDASAARTPTFVPT